MEFRTAVDGLCTKVDHGDVAKALGVSVQTVRQARMKPEARAYRQPPEKWENAMIRLAEDRVWHYRKLIEALRERQAG